MNGVGPRWFPGWLRATLTDWSKHFFDEAAWDIHDRGYARGYPDRATCDLLFWQAMLRDASQTTTATRTWACVLLSTFYFVLVRSFGWTAYRYHHE